MTSRKEKILEWTCRKTDCMLMEVIDELQASAAFLRCLVDRNLRVSDALLDETAPAGSRPAIVTFIDCNLQTWVCVVFVTLFNLEVCQFR